MAAKHAQTANPGSFLFRKNRGKVENQRTLVFVTQRALLVRLSVFNELLGVLSGLDVCHEELQNEANLDKVKDQAQGAENEVSEDHHHCHAATEGAAGQRASEAADGAAHDCEEQATEPPQDTDYHRDDVDDGSELHGDEAGELEVKQGLEEAILLRLCLLQALRVRAKALLCWLVEAAVVLLWIAAKSLLAWLTWLRLPLLRESAKALLWLARLVLLALELLVEAALVEVACRRDRLTEATLIEAIA